MTNLDGSVLDISDSIPIFPAPEDVGHEYYFRIDSLERTPVDVPEPSMLLIFISGLLLMQWKIKKLFA
ncbi:MAG: PEP-CTERM sorting domain-containing protein [Pseudomonadota bacterium]